MKDNGFQILKRCKYLLLVQQIWLLELPEVYAAEYVGPGWVPVGLMDKDIHPASCREGRVEDIIFPKAYQQQQQ